jgi:murein biosynthesis integral membrane protein MurJ
MPVFNAGRYLRLAVLSIVKQTFTDWELLIIDDGSTDSALQDIADIRDHRIRILRDGKNKGLAARLNEAIDLARGLYFARMDQDDVSYPERFARQIEALGKDPSLDLVAVRAVAISADNRLTGMMPCPATQAQITEKPWRGFYLPHPTWMGRIEWFRKHRYKEPGPYFCEDQELLLRSHEVSRFGVIMEPLFAYRLREGINWRKLIKTRLTVLPVQLNHFLSKGQLFFALMALLTFFGRAALDILKAVLGIAYPIVRVKDGEIAKGWQAILQSVQGAEGDVTGSYPIYEKPVNLQKHLAPVLWVIFFCYAICAALIFQKLLLPLVPSLHAGGGLLSNDSVYFDSVAWKIAQEIHLNGWSSFQPFEASGNVMVLSVLYAIFGHDPALIIPVNAALHAFGGLLVFLLVRELAGREPIGIFAGFTAAGLFVIFPSALNWYGQLHKDGYAIAGTLLILLIWIKAVRGPASIRGWLALVIGYFAGVLLIGSVRPYNLKILLIATLGACLSIFVIALLRRRFFRVRMLLLFFVIAVITTAGGIKSTAHLSMGEASYADWQSPKWQWQDSSWLPDVIETYIETAARTRVGLIHYGLHEKAKSIIDVDVMPKNTVEVAGYLPRALQVALFAPFPSMWLTNLSLPRMVATGEMFIYYLCIPGIVLLLRYKRSPPVLISLYFACCFLLVYGFVSANLGTLYRLRYGYLFIMLLLGVLGWFVWLENTGRLGRIIHWLTPPVPSTYNVEASMTERILERKKTMGAGFLVMLLTFLCFVGFFFRDLMMAQIFGLGAALDYFFIALLIPMFIVTVFYMPLGAAFVPVYLDARERLIPQAIRAMISNISSWTGASLIIACLILYHVGPSLLPLLYTKESPPDMGQLSPLLNLALPILLFSGVVILGNSILNAHGRAVAASAAQLVVPVTAVAALLMLGEKFGVKAVMYGMVCGQVLNLLIVQFYLRQDDIWIMSRPDFQYSEGLSSLLKQYWPLAAAALFIGLTIPVATLLAMSLPGGSVSAFNLGTKVVLFITGLLGAAVSAVMLPYFSLLVARSQLVAARRELSFFLLLATFISVPVSAGLFLWSEPIVRLIFERGSFDSDATGQVARVMQYSIVQLPFFVCNSLLIRFATATRHVMAICAVSFLGLLVNIGAGILLMKHMGVGGIALGASLSVLTSTLFLLMVLVRYGYVTGLDMIIVMLNWLFFLTLLMCFHFQSVPGIYVTLLAFVVLMGGYLNSLKSTQEWAAGTNP